MVLQCLHFTSKGTQIHNPQNKQILPALALERVIQCLHWLWRELFSAYIGSRESRSISALAIRILLNDFRHSKALAILGWNVSFI